MQTSTTYMTRRRRLLSDGTREAGSAVDRNKRTSHPKARRRAKRLDTTASPESPKHRFPLQSINISDLYRPLKKPVTLRLDADVLAWFKKDGRRYQTRINSALRKVMEREMKE